MSWFADTQLFLYNNGSYICRIKKEYGIPVTANDYEDREAISFSKDLSLGNIRESESDCAAFISSFYKDKRNGYKAINSQGLVITLEGPEYTMGTWSREEQNSLFYNLPGVTKYEAVTGLLADTKQALKKKISSLQDEAKSNKEEKQAMEIENATLKNEVKRLKDGLNAEKSTNQKHEEVLSRFAALESLDLQVLDLTSKLVQCCGTGGGSFVEEQPWNSGHTILSNWVPFDELDVLTFSKVTPLTITKDAGAPKFLEDKTTNVRASHFHRGVYPIALVNVEELIPNREEARFDRDVWGSYNNAGINYAARKQFASEISVDAYKTR